MHKKKLHDWAAVAKYDYKDKQWVMDKWAIDFCRAPLPLAMSGEIIAGLFPVEFSFKSQKIKELK